MGHGATGSSDDKSDDIMISDVRCEDGAVDREHASLMHLHMDTRSWCYVCRDALCCVCVCVCVCLSVRLFVRVGGTCVGVMSDVFWWGNGDGIERCFG